MRSQQPSMVCMRTALHTDTAGTRRCCHRCSLTHPQEPMNSSFWSEMAPASQPAQHGWARAVGWVAAAIPLLLVGWLGGVSLLGVPPTPHLDQCRARCTCGCRSRRGLSTGRQALSSAWPGPAANQRRFVLLHRWLHSTGSAQQRAPAPAPNGAPWLLLLPPLTLQEVRRAPAAGPSAS